MITFDTGYGIVPSFWCCYGKTRLHACKLLLVWNSCKLLPRFYAYRVCSLLVLPN
jgi:hypothetical protein